MAPPATYADTVDTGDRLSFTFFIATAIHVLMIYFIGFTSITGNKVAPTLNITIATHKSLQEPEKADFLAQHNQEASGTADDIKELTTRELAELDDLNVRQVRPETQIEAQEVQRQEHNQIISTNTSQNQQVALLDDSKTRQYQDKVDGQQRRNIMPNPEYASLKAKLDKLKQDLANKPRIRRLTSESTKASADAEYLNAWAQKVEFVGIENFPKQALDNRIFGSLRLGVTLLPNGVVDDIEILKSSGHSILDEAAMHIVRLSSPFQPIPKEVRKDNDKLEIIRTWNFEISGLTTSNSELN